MTTSSVFQSERARLFAIAYRMLGSASDAEDVLQDAWLRYESADRSNVRSPVAFATTIVTRLCLDRLKAARATREHYVGPWLPEPVLTESIAAPDALAERAESVTLAFLVMLEALSPEERAVLLLREVFDYDHADVAAMLDTTSDNSRQLLHRAKARLTRPRLVPSPRDVRRAVAQRFADALAAGDAAALTALLTGDVELVSDGGGKVAAARRPIAGREAVVAFLVGLRRTALRNGLAADASLHIDDVNHEAAVIVRVAAQVESVFVLAVSDDLVTAIRVARNPDKLAHLSRQLAEPPS
ncbi:MAG: RNA polymerase sigma factor SigJ [Vicinamibacterales bacterium]